jgi:hypothetical protein
MSAELRQVAKGKCNFFAECHQGHSAKTPSPSPRRRDGGFSLPSTAWHSAKSVSSARKKVLDKEGFADVLFAEPSLPNAKLGKACAECFSGFAECFRHSAKRSIPVVAPPRTHGTPNQSHLLLASCHRRSCQWRRRGLRRRTSLVH